MVDPPRCSDWITASSEPAVPRSLWAMAQTAPLSCGVATARPVETSFWVCWSSLAVAVRFCNATNAPGLLFTLSMTKVLFLRVRRRFDGRGHFAQAASTQELDQSRHAE